MFLGKHRCCESEPDFCGMFGLFYEVLHWAVPNAHTGLPAPPPHSATPLSSSYQSSQPTPHSLHFTNYSHCYLEMQVHDVVLQDLLELIATQVAGEGGSTNRQECYQTRAQQRQFITNQQWFISRSACRLPVASLNWIFWWVHHHL